MRPTGTTGRCARSSSKRASPTCWRSPATTWSHAHGTAPGRHPGRGRGLAPGQRRERRQGPPLVTMAPPPPRTRPALPLPATTPARSLSEAGVLIRKVRCSPTGVAGEGGAAQRTDAAQGLALTTTELHVDRVGMVRVALDPYVSVLPLVTDALGRRRCAAGVAQAYSRLAVTAVRRALHHVTTPRYSILPDSMTSMNPACEMPVGDQTFSFSNASSLVLNCGH